MSHKVSSSLHRLTLIGFNQRKNTWTSYYLKNFTTINFPLSRMFLLLVCYIKCSTTKNFSKWGNKGSKSNVIFSLTFFSKKDRISHSRKVQNKNFLVINKYHISINFLAQKDRIFHAQKIQNYGSLATSKRCSMLKKIPYRFCCWFFFRTEI